MPKRKKPSEWKQYGFLRALDNLEILKARFYTHAYGRHYHEGYAMGLILEGSESYHCNRRINVAPKGSIVLVNPGEVHTGQASNQQTGWGYFMIYPHLSLVRKALAQLGLNSRDLPFFPQTVVRDEGIAAGLYRFMDAVESGDARLAVESRFLRLLNGLIRRHGDVRPASDGLPDRIKPRAPEKEKIRIVTDMIHERAGEDITLEALAASVGLTPWALLRRFKKQTGISPYLLQTRLKLSQAKQDLKSGISLAETAARSGFSDQSHMTKQFKRWLGITPGEYAAGTFR